MGSGTRSARNNVKRDPHHSRPQAWTGSRSVKLCASCPAYNSITISGTRTQRFAASRRRTMKLTTLRPGLLVSLKTSIVGNTEYRRVQLEADHVTEEGTRRARWETERT